MEGLHELVEAAKEAANEARRGRGRPEGTSILPKNHIFELAEIYESSAYPRPITADSALADSIAGFIEQFLIAAGKEKASANDYGSEALKYQERKAKKKGGR